jgi:hypothetical protein
LSGYTGSTLATLRTAVRDLLNEATAGFWTDAQLNRYLGRSRDRYYRKLVVQDPSFGKQTKDITYTAGAESVLLAIDDFREAIMLEDRTGGGPGFQIPFADSLEQLYSRYSITTTGSNAGVPEMAFLQNTQTGSTTTLTQSLYLHLAPYPSGARSLRLHYRAHPVAFTGGDTYTSGMPSEWDDCIVIQAAIWARMQEEKPNLEDLLLSLEKAEYEARKTTISLKRGNDHVVYYDDN